MQSDHIKEDDNISIDLDDEESELVNDLDDDILRSHLGYGSLGVIPLPTRHDEYEHMVVNFRGPGGKGEVKDISLLVFGGINFKGEESRETFHLQIDQEKKTFVMTYMPKARLRVADRFIDNQHLHMNTDTNIVTMVGKHALTRINTSAPIDKLRWVKYKRNLGYDS